MWNRDKTVVATLNFCFSAASHIRFITSEHGHSCYVHFLKSAFVSHVFDCISSPNQHPRWSPLTSLPPPPLTPGGNTSGSTAEEMQTDRRWWLQLEPCGRSSENHRQVTSTYSRKVQSQTSSVCTVHWRWRCFPGMMETACLFWRVLWFLKTTVRFFLQFFSVLFLRVLVLDHSTMILPK